MEELMPERAAQAVEAAYKESITAGHTVLIVANDTLYSVSPDQTRTAIKAVPKRTKVVKGTRIKLR